MTVTQLSLDLDLSDLSPKRLSRFWRYVLVAENNSCWLWTRCTNKAGYGQSSLRGVTQCAHRIAYRLTKGCLGELVVLHSCDTPACCNPAHLSSGTDADNVRDRHTKGRTSSKVTAEQVRAIKAEYLKGRGKLLAQRYGIDRTTLSDIITGRTWKHTV